MATGRQRRAAVENADIIQSKKAAFKEILAKAVLAIHPPAEVQHQFRKRPFKELNVPFAAQRLLCPIQKDRGPSVHGWIYVAEVPLIGGDLTGRMQKVLLQHQV